LLAKAYDGIPKDGAAAMPRRQRDRSLHALGLVHGEPAHTFGQIRPADPDVRQQRRVLDAFMAAVRDGDFERLVGVLDPDIVLRADGGALAGASRLVRGAQAVAAQAASFSRLGLSTQCVLVNSNLGVVSRRPDGRAFAVLGFTIAGGKVVEIDILADPERLSRLDVSAIES
jgi:RNA polymerase sigma-70 factor (ECF subfamily)